MAHEVPVDEEHALEGMKSSSLDIGKVDKVEKSLEVLEQEENPYLALRAAKIAQNDARLAALGLLRPLVVSVPSKKTRRRPPKTPAPMDSSCLRRSPRHTNRSITNVVPDPPEPRRKRSKVHTGSPEKRTKKSPPSSLSSKSVRNIKLNVESLCHDFLGMIMQQTGKAHVIEESARRSGSSQEHYGLSFNKYSGVQEWNNDALFLWVNLGGAGTVVNDFRNCGQQMTWFGGSRMHDESNVILRLLRVGQLAKHGRLPATDGIVLWCRRYCEEKRTFGPYVCLGRLAYHSHVPNSRPLQFVWSLLDCDRLRNHDEATVRNTFKSLIQ